MGDPRESSLPRCIEQAEPAHAARQIHSPSGANGEGRVDNALLALVRNREADREAKRKSPCHYGADCRDKTKEHRIRFSHPESWEHKAELSAKYAYSGQAGPREHKAEASTTSSRTNPTGYSDNSSRLRELTATSGVDGSQPSPLGDSARSALFDSKPLCKYAEDCFNKNPQHLREFSHPKMGTKSKEQADMEIVHELLNMGKAGNWDRVKRLLAAHPRLVNCRPQSRTFALVHFAAAQVHFSILEWLVMAGADLTLKTKDGQSVEQVLHQSMSASPPSSQEMREKDEAMKEWVRRRLIS